MSRYLLQNPVRRVLGLVGIVTILSGVVIGINYHFNDEIQNAEEQLKAEPRFKELIERGEMLFIGSWVVMVAGGVVLLAVDFFLLYRVCKV